MLVIEEINALIAAIQEHFHKVSDTIMRYFYQQICMTSFWNFDFSSDIIFFPYHSTKIKNPEKSFKEQ